MLYFSIKHKLIAATLVALVATTALHWVGTRDPGTARLQEGEGETLVVIAPPLGGVAHMRHLEILIRQNFQGADFIVPTYANNWLSNIEPEDLTDLLELAIHEAHEKRGYKRIVLFGFSLGGTIVRKAFVWGHGKENDRKVARNKRAWVDKVERLVSLAAPNRGWRHDVQPRGLSTPQYWLSRVLFETARITGTARLLRGIAAGSPFIANLRLQWIEVARSDSARSQFPLVVHLLGTRDELVSLDDSRDLEAARGVIFRSVPGATHLSIGTQIFENDDVKSKPTPIGADIQLALTAKRDEFPHGWSDWISDARLVEEPKVKRLIYIMHGIRDEGDWIPHIENQLREALGTASDEVRVIPAKYGRFHMLPFLLYWDRQKNVRWFMDLYTENRAKYPFAETVDFIGHSNGTYILASGLQQYSSLRIRNALLLGSVVPSHYDWSPLLKSNQVGTVRNVVSNDDWVVAIFPHVFQQVSKLRATTSSVGLFDIGSAGFRGFDRADGSRVRDIKFTVGGHSGGVDVFDPGKLDALVKFAAFGQDDGLTKIFEKEKAHWEPLYYASNLAWLIWIALAGLVAGGARIANRFGRRWLVGYLLVLLGLLVTI